MTYLSDTAKQHIKSIIKRWEELGHEPSHKEFNSDPKVTNAIASCFGSYGDAVKAARYYYNHPESRYKLDPPPPPPPATPKKGKKKRGASAKKTQSIQQTPPKPLEQPTPLKAEEIRVAPKESLKTPLAPPEEPKIVPEEAETQTRAPSVDEQAEPEALISDETAPQETAPQKPVETTTIVEPEVIVNKEATTMNNTLINLLESDVRLVNEEQYYRAKALAGILPDISPLKNGGAAIIMKAELPVDSYCFEAEDTHVDIPIVSVYGHLSLVKDGAIYDFPEPKEGVFLLVSREVAEAARECGRETDDLIFPLEYTTRDRSIYCKKLGRLQ